MSGRTLQQRKLNTAVSSPSRYSFQEDAKPNPRNTNPLLMGPILLMTPLVGIRPS